ncbi:PREDICTED: uncharacterized protein LOC105954874 [Erythranthe guttata]|uniref:uncharacterized protein LOC105954874 n=1 Tax=Erythranthe guttata TaxID=4155 RepID=UPI00064DF138|nr:PREDICTED: uncharacterized protein LOC105954874 [Erythranthe guttata]|eukprot:XP_012834010.1 PREDICTED: uncharacterized protein LOC105954874 [Erythranthe guttata]
MKTATSDSSSVGLVTRSMAKKLQASSKTSSTPQTVKKGLPPLVNTSADVEGSKREISQPMPHSTSSYSEMASVMTTNATTMEEQIASLTKAIEGLAKHVQQRDSQIAKLIEKMNKADASQIVEQIEAQDEVEASTKQQPVENEKAPAQDFQVSPGGMVHVDQVMTLISGTIKDKLEGGSKSPSTYVKPYTQRIDDLRMPMGYIPPKFQQFDGKGNPKQHVAHFVETCNDAGTYGDHLVKQFVRSLKDNAFDWYIDLGANSIDSWKHLEEEFLNRFYSTRRTVIMIELTNSRQWKKEPVIHYINRWRNLSFNCKDRLPETSAIELCIQGMQWGLRYILQGIQPKSFGELATRAHDMELSILANQIEESPFKKPYQLNEEHVEEEQKDHEDGGKSFEEATPYAI